MTDETTTLETRPEAPEMTPYEVMEKVIANGDLAQMAPQDRLAFYWRACESLGLNPLTRPFLFIKNREGQLTMYASKDATEQLRRVNHVSVTRLDREERTDLAMVTAYVRDRSGREDSALGAVSIQGLRGGALADAWMKAETKAKRRATLSLVGLGFLDESEIGSVGAPVGFDETTGDIVDQPSAPPPSLLEQVQQQAASLSRTDEEPVAPEAEPETPPEPEQEAEKPILTEPMPVEESAKLSVVRDEDEPEDGGYQPLSSTPGLPIDGLSTLAKAAGVGKLAFASALQVVPADVGKTIEGMDDEQRYALALQLKLIP